MAYKYATQIGNEHTAQALGKSLTISPKISVEICNHLRYRQLNEAKKVLNSVIAFKQAIPVRKFNANLGHKPGIGPGRYPIKACKAFLKLFDSVESNAQFKGLNTSLLQIVHLCSHKAGEPRRSGRRNRTTKRAHIEIIVEEKAENKDAQKRTVKKSESK